jgi:hypothetical protein
VVGMEIINATPHDITIISDGEKIVIPKSNLIIRLKERRVKVGELEINGKKVNVNRVEYETSDIPPEKEGVFYIVSSLIAGAFPNRKDLLIVDETIRDEKGTIVGCKSFATIFSFNFLF